MVSAEALTNPLWSEDDAYRSATEVGGTTTPVEQAELVVVGLGAAGLSAATAAAESGLDVIGVDAGCVGGGASGRNGGFLLAGAADFHHVLARRIGARRATAFYERTLAELAHQLTLTPGAVRRLGSIRLATTDDEQVDCRDQAAAMRRDGLDVAEVIGPFGSGLYFPHDATMHPGRRCQALAERAGRAGVRLLTHTPVLHIRRVDGVSLICPGRQINARKVLVAIDGGVERVLPALRGRVRTARAQMLATVPGSVSFERVPAAMYARYGYDYWQRLPDGRLVLGGARDVGGAAEWTQADGVTNTVQVALETIAATQLDVRPRVTHRWSGLLGFTANRLPICSVVEPDLAVASGYCGTGNVLGPLTARAALALLFDRPSPDAALLTGASPFVLSARP